MTDEPLDPDLNLEVDLRLAPALDEAFAERVLRLARAELPSEAPAASLPVRVRGALVPMLLVSAGGCRTTLTVEEIPSAYHAPDPERP